MRRRSIARFRRPTPSDVVISDRGSWRSTTSDTTFTTTAFASLGSTSKVLFIGCGGYRASSVAVPTSVTANGAASYAAQEVVSLVRTNVSGAIWVVNLPPSETSVTITVTFSNSNSNVGVQCWSATNVQSTSAIQTDTDSKTTGALMTVNLDVPAGGCAVGFTMSKDAGSHTWTNLTEDSDDAGASTTSSGASDDFASAQTALAITCDPTTVAPCVLAVASFR